MRNMYSTLRTFFAGTLLLFGLPLMAQSTKELKKFTPAINRQLFHNYIDQAQKKALEADGRADNAFYASSNEEVNYGITEALTKEIDKFQWQIEYDSSIAHGKKVAYLKGMENMLKAFYTKVKGRSFNASNWPSVVNLYLMAVDKDKRNQSVADIIGKNNDEVGNMIMSSGAFNSNPG